MDRIGRYEIRERLGAGAMGVVYRAFDTRLNRDVAIKVLSGGLAEDADAVRRFEQEARAASALNHPNILTVFDAAVDGRTAYIVTELLQGTTLSERIGGRPLPLAATLDYARQMAAGLAAAHAAGIVHRDIKPQNIFVTRAGVIKLLDFGIARIIAPPATPSDRSETRLPDGTQVGVVVGTPAYMAPEQIRGQSIDRRTDIFAFGCVMHEMLTGSGPFAHASGADAMAAVLNQAPVPRTDTAAVPPAVDRIVARCLAKDPDDRFQSAADLAFAIETAQLPAGPGGVSAARVSPMRLAAGATVSAAAVAAMVLWPRSATPSSPVTAPPVIVSATTVVPASARPLAPALSPDGKWVTYIGLSGGESNLYVQFLNGEAPLQLTKDGEFPLQTRAIVGALDVSPDGAGIAVAGRPRPVGLWQIPGIWIVPAPLGGPPRRMGTRYASMRWSPDGQQIAAILANPLIGDAVVVASADGQNERTLVPASNGIHLHHVTWGHDGRYVYYSRTLEPNHSLGEIGRVLAAGGTPEIVVPTQGTAMYPAPTPDGRALIYAGDRNGEGLNIWWRPFDGSPEQRLTTGTGEFTEPYISRDGHRLVTLARRRRGGLVSIRADEGVKAVAEPVVTGMPGDTDPSVDFDSGRVFLTSVRSGRRKIWSVALDGSNPVPLTSGSDDDRRPSVSRDGRQVAFVSNRDGRRGIWLVPAAGGAPRKLIETDVIDYVTWAPDNRRVAYATAGGDAAHLWIANVDGTAPVSLPSTNARVPAWSPVADQVAFVSVVADKPYVHVVTADGRPVREPISIDPVSLPTAIAWSPDGSRLALVNLPGRTAAEAWILDVASGRLRKVAELQAPAEFEGVSWTKDGRSLLLGHAEFDSEVLLLQLK